MLKLSSIFLHKTYVCTTCTTFCFYFPRRKAKKEINIFQYFSQKQIQEFKEAFGIMDTDKDGIVTASDLKVCCLLLW